VASIFFNGTSGVVDYGWGAYAPSSGHSPLRRSAGFNHQRAASGAPGGALAGGCSGGVGGLDNLVSGSDIAVRKIAVRK
jgi:hypothetical protein